MSHCLAAARHFSDIIQAQHTYQKEENEGKNDNFRSSNTHTIFIYFFFILHYGLLSLISLIKEFNPKALSLALVLARSVSIIDLY